jgi:hypothetical protein
VLQSHTCVRASEAAREISAVVDDIVHCPHLARFALSAWATVGDGLAVMPVSSDAGVYSNAGVYTEIIHTLILLNSLYRGNSKQD